MFYELRQSTQVSVNAHFLFVAIIHNSMVDVWFMFGEPHTIADSSNEWNNGNGERL